MDSGHCEEFLFTAASMPVPIGASIWNKTSSV